MNSAEWFICEDCIAERGPFKICPWHLAIVKESTIPKYGWAMEQIGRGLSAIHISMGYPAGCIWLWEDSSCTLHCIHGIMLQDAMAIIWITGGGRN